MPDASDHALELSIQCAAPVTACPVDRRRIRRWAQGALQRDAQLTIRFVGSREGRRLNNEFRGRDYATNVLTFPYHSSGERICADIVLCMPVVRREARAQRKSPGAHLAHLVVHGVLHACGHDHMLPGQAARMEAAEVALLARFRIADPWAER